MRSQDIDNTHVISLIERMLTKDDLQVCAHHIYPQKLEPWISNLLQWMVEELTARLRSGAAFLKNASSRTNNHVVASINQQEMARVNPTITDKNQTDAIYNKDAPYDRHTMHHLTNTYTDSTTFLTRSKTRLVALQTANVWYLSSSLSTPHIIQHYSMAAEACGISLMISSFMEKTKPSTTGTWGKFRGGS